MIRLAATSIGPIAADILGSHQDIEVLAVFERSFYVMTEGGLVCFGAEGIGRGPINVPIADADEIDWRRLGVDGEVKGHSHHDEVQVGDELAIALARAQPWQPPPWPTFVPATAARGLAALRGLAAGQLPREGLAPLVLADPARELHRSSLEARAAAGVIAGLAEALPRALERDRSDADLVRGLTLLLGLGPGLTPSGDDLIGGLMLALTALDRASLRDRLWHALTPELAELTTEISAMHLSAAADGLGAEAVHELLAAVLGADVSAMPGRLDSVARIGHCSGWDTLAGFTLLLDAALASTSQRHPRPRADGP